MSKPLIQIDDQIREMNDEEYERYLEKVANAHPPLEGHDEALIASGPTLPSAE